MSPKKPLSDYKILYIEDDENNTSLMKRILEAAGYRFLSAPNGSLGLREAHRERPDLILLDLYMPDISGHEVASLLRRMTRTKDTPILVVSASQYPHDITLSQQIGCNGYIPKPIDIDLISQQVAAFL